MENGGSGVECYKILGRQLWISDCAIAHFYSSEFGKIGVPQTPAVTERCSDPFLLDASIQSVSERAS